MYLHALRCVSHAFLLLFGLMCVDTHALVWYDPCPCSVPVLVLTGSEDNLVRPKNSELLAKALGVPVLVLKGAGHGLIHEARAQVSPPDAPPHNRFTPHRTPVPTHQMWYCPLGTVTHERTISCFFFCVFFSLSCVCLCVHVRGVGGAFLWCAIYALACCQVHQALDLHWTRASAQATMPVHDPSPGEDTSGDGDTGVVRVPVRQPAANHFWRLASLGCQHSGPCWSHILRGGVKAGAISFGLLRLAVLARCIVLRGSLSRCVSRVYVW